MRAGARGGSPWGLAGRAGLAYDLSMQPRGSTSLRLGLAAAATYFIAHLLGWDALALLMKPAPVLCLLAFLLPVRNRDAALIAGGLLLSAIGDLLLEASPALFLPGLVAFLLAHVAYIVAFVGRTSRPQLRRLVPVLVFTGLGLHVLGPHLGAMYGPVLAYVAVISVMVWRAGAQIGAEGTGGLRSWNMLPASVRARLRVVRWTSWTPSLASRRATRRLTVDFGSPSRSPAAVNEPVSATLRNATISSMSGASDCSAGRNIASLYNSLIQTAATMPFSGP